MDNSNQINELLTSVIDKIKGMADVNAAIGLPFETKDGTLIFPLTKMSIGFVAGGGEYGSDSKNFKNSKKYPLAGGSGGGVSIEPLALLQIKDNETKLIYIDEKSLSQKLLDTTANIVSNITNIFKKDSDNDKK